jgi:hypothetical protein
MVPAEQIAKLDESLRLYADVIESFERARERMLDQRRGAMIQVKVHLDELLALNDRRIDSLNSSEDDKHATSAGEVAASKVTALG